MIDKPIYKVKLEISGKYDIEVRHWNDERTSFTSDFYPDIKNKIVNQGLDFYGGVVPAGSYLAQALGAIIVGTGNAAPLPTDTTLQVPLALQAFNGSGWTNPSNATPPYSTGCSSVTTFGVGAVVGNIAEIGLSFTKSSGSTINDAIFSRALIQVGGSPGTISLTASDQLVVTYTLSWSYANDTTGSIIVTTDGTPSAANNFTVRPYFIGNPISSSAFADHPFQAILVYNNSGSIQAWASNATALQASTVTSAPGTVVRADSASASAYTTGSFTRNYNLHWNTGHNFVDQLYFVQMMMMGFQMLFTTGFGPTSVQTLDLALQMSWSSAT